VLVTGLERFGLKPASFRRFGNRNVTAYVYLRTYDVTASVRRLSPSKRFAYMSARVDGWVKNLIQLHPKLSLQVMGSNSTNRHKRAWSQLPTTLKFLGKARDLLQFASAGAVRSVHVTRIAGLRRRPYAKSLLRWYCVRAFVVIRVEGAKSGQQNIEDRFVLVRARSFEDAKHRLKQQWREYAAPYLNSEGQMVSWQLDRIVDVYDTCETKIDAAGTEVYSKLSHRRMRPEYVWRPKSR
jgi:hypothetical protein